MTACVLCFVAGAVFAVAFAATFTRLLFVAAERMERKP